MSKIKITAISDLHGERPELPGGNLLIVAGDCTARDNVKDWTAFFDWLTRQQYEKKILVGGNHDGFLAQCISHQESREMDLLGECGYEYLLDTGTTYRGLKIWGTPWSLPFDGCDPRCAHFMAGEEELKLKYDAIPEDTDILVSHAPMCGLFDGVVRWNTGKIEWTGSVKLRDTIERVMPKAFIHGHIHEYGGKRLLFKDWGEKSTWVYSVSYLDEDYIARDTITNFEMDVQERRTDYV